MSILHRHRTNAENFTSMMTAAQRSAVEMTLATHPALRGNHELAATVAAERGFSLSESRLSPGERLLKLAGGE